MFTTNKIKAIKFFAANAGYATPPGRMVCALHLANAEEWAKKNAITFEWGFDDDIDDSWMSEAEKKRDHTWEYCVANHPTFGIMASLGGIVDADNSYRRVIEAEMALEAKEQFDWRINKAYAIA